MIGEKVAVLPEFWQELDCIWPKPFAGFSTGVREGTWNHAFTSLKEAPAGITGARIQRTNQSWKAGFQLDH